MVLFLNNLLWQYLAKFAQSWFFKEFEENLKKITSEKIPLGPP